MPELPEVETIRLGLQKYVVGKTIEGVEVRLKKIVSGDPKKIIGAKVVGVRRFGKGLVIDLSNQYSIAIHIKMTGQLIFRGPEVSKVPPIRQAQGKHVSKGKIGGELPNKWTHVIFKIKNQKSKIKNTIQKSKVKNDSGHSAFLYYNDLRQFGWIKVIRTDEVKNLPFFKDLGPEPPAALGYSSSERRESRSNNQTMRQLSNGSSRQARTILTLDLFRQILSKSNLSIKPLLMDQKKMSGVGNIYANDALFEARIDPQRKAKQITKEEAESLYNSILKVLKKGLEQGGATELNFVNVLGQEGGYQDHFLVYGREKEPCRVCRTPIQKIKLGGRGTYFCPQCQR